MLNLLSYLGMSLQSELCLWNMLGLVTTIFDATLFKVNANLKQVWAMEMPSQLSTSVQRALRTMISGIMLVQCFTVYIYLASYIVMLYPIYLEERPSLLLPWLLLAAVKKLLCELLSLTLGLGTCVLVGPARSACIKFVISKIAGLLPAFYMWMLVFSYYTTLKLPNSYLKFPVERPTGSDQDGLELAVRRRRTKSLLDEKQLRSRLLQSISSSQSIPKDKTEGSYRTKQLYSTAAPMLSDTSVDGAKNDADIARPFSVASNVEWMEDWFGSEIAMPRDSDRVVNQFSLMLLRIAAFINSGESDTRKFLQSQVTKSSCDDDSRPSYRSTYRKSEAPTVKSDEAVVSIECDSQRHQFCSISSNKTEDSDVHHTFISDSQYESSEAIVEIDTKENLSPWDRTRKAKSVKLNTMLRRKRSKHFTKVKVNQSIIDLINQCQKKVQEKAKKETNFVPLVSTRSNKTSTSSIHHDFVDTNNETFCQSTSTGNRKVYEKQETKSKRGIDIGISTHDKAVSKITKEQMNISRTQALPQKIPEIEKNINVRSTLSEQIVPQENIEDNGYDTFDDLNTQKMIDKGVTTHDKVVSKSQEEYKNKSTMQPLSPKSSLIGKNIDAWTTWSEDILSHDNIDENHSNTSDNSNPQKVHLESLNLSEDTEPTEVEDKKKLKGKLYQYSDSEGESQYSSALDEKIYEEENNGEIFNELARPSNSHAEHFQRLILGSGTIEKHEYTGVRDLTDETEQPNSVVKSLTDNSILSNGSSNLESKSMASEEILSQTSSEDKKMTVLAESPSNTSSQHTNKQQSTSPK